MMEHKRVDTSRLYRNGKLLCDLLMEIHDAEERFGKAAEERYHDIKILTKMGLEYTEEIIALREEIRQLKEVQDERNQEAR